MFTLALKYSLCRLVQSLSIGFHPANFLNWCSGELWLQMVFPFLFGAKEFTKGFLERLFRVSNIATEDKGELEEYHSPIPLQGVPIQIPHRRSGHRLQLAG